MKLKKEKKQVINIFNNSNDAQNNGKKDLILNIDNSPFKNTIFRRIKTSKK